MLEEVEKLLLVWLNGKQLVDDSVSKTMICEKACILHNYLLQEKPSTGAACDEVKAGRGWFGIFCKRSSTHMCDKMW